MSGADRDLPTAKMLAVYPCDRELWLRLHAIGKSMVKLGHTGDVTPLRAFQHQRYRAGRRGIEWKLTLAEWWEIWESSGHWHERGWGRGYMMCRIGDVGPYAVGNVFIAPGEENLSAAGKRSGTLPMGVAPCRSSKANPFMAYCNIDGKRTHLGVFPTAEAAHAAYLAARDFDRSLKMRRAA